MNLKLATSDSGPESGSDDHEDRSGRSGRLPARCARPPRACLGPCHSSGQRATRASERHVLGARRDDVLDARRSMPTALGSSVGASGLSWAACASTGRSFPPRLAVIQFASRVAAPVSTRRRWAFLTRRTRPVSHPAAVIRASILMRSVRKILPGCALRRCKERQRQPRTPRQLWLWSERPRHARAQSTWLSSRTPLPGLSQERRRQLFREDSPTDDPPASAPSSVGLVGHVGLVGLVGLVGPSCRLSLPRWDRDDAQPTRTRREKRGSSVSSWAHGLDLLLVAPPLGLNTIDG